MPASAPRPPRPGGRRRSGVPWLALAYVALCAAVVVPVVLVLVDGLDHALRALLIFGTAFVLCFRMSRRQALPQADSIEDFPTAADSVLFLRPFRGEKAPFSQSDDRHGRHRLKALVVDPDEEFLSFERYLGPELTAQVGPIIGLGAPGDRLPPEGPVVRHYASDLSWQDDIERLIPAVRCIIMLPQTSEPLRDELRLIRAHRATGKLFLVLGPYDEPGEQATGRRAPARLRTSRALMGAQPPRWTELVPVFAEHGLVLPPRHPGPGSVIAFRSDGRAVVLASGLDRAADYVSAIAGRLPGQ
ncbi:hypothetical protein [Pseudonocardia humida]|uniref:Uncharacterized protein n=1 Tax=Pseudonocardia humida TaxID=2800819 RepID=A0ABT1A050_9PSEU|nr:hypothetical protein [Pseudonocardia humida]MCO1656346.1 hypothetical protein [Pseudonocardia humida]